VTVPKRLRRSITGLIFREGLITPSMRYGGVGTVGFQEPRDDSRNGADGESIGFAADSKADDLEFFLQ